MLATGLLNVWLGLQPQILVRLAEKSLNPLSVVETIRE
jgi:hypothetical protein